MYDIFSLPEVRFPQDFLWGSATAGHQIEGDNIHSQMWHEEQAGRIPLSSGKACDHYRLFREDADMIAALGHQAYRFSLEWSRIEPEEGRWDEAAIAHYRELLERLKSNGVRTFVTLCHWTVPQWFEERGGLAKKENIHWFERYVAKIVPLIADCVDGWNVLNESFYSKPGFEARSFNCMRIHGRCYHLIKQYSRAPVSSAHMALQPFPNRYYDELDGLMAHVMDFRINGMILHAIKTGEMLAPDTDAEYCPELKNAMDFWSLNIYTRHMVDSRRADLTAPRFPHKKLRMIDMDFYLEEMYPEGTTAMLERFSDRPVYITENGCSCDDDRFRIVYLALYLSAIHDAMERGVDVRGYFYWSLLDNFEWGSFKPRFGMVDVDFATFSRTPKPSAAFYKEIIANHGFDQSMIRRYLDVMPSLRQD